MNGGGIDTSIPSIENAWTIAFEDLAIGREIGSGGFGKVYMGDYLGTPVAIKKIHIAPDDPNRKDLEKFLHREIETIKLFRHPNVIQFVGVAEKQGILYIVTELVQGGDLQWYLKNRSIDLPWLLRINIALDVSLAMSYLHSKNIVHRDLKSSNLLIDTQWKVKVCDFGFARIVDDENNKSMTICGTDNWMAPEMITGQDYDESCDVFSFGMLLYELITRNKPTPNMRLANYSVNAEMMVSQVGADCPEAFLMLMLQCSQFNPNDRPAFKLISQTLKTMKVDLFGENPSLQYPSLRSMANGTNGAPPPLPQQPQPGGLIADAKKIISTGQFDQKNSTGTESDDSDSSFSSDTDSDDQNHYQSTNETPQNNHQQQQQQPADQEDDDIDNDDELEVRDGEDDDYDEDVDASGNDDDDDDSNAHITQQQQQQQSGTMSASKRNVSFNISKTSYHTYEKESDYSDDDYYDDDDYDDEDEEDEIDYDDEYDDDEEYDEYDENEQQHHQQQNQRYQNIDVDYDAEEDDDDDDDRPPYSPQSDDPDSDIDDVIIHDADVSFDSSDLVKEVISAANKNNISNTTVDISVDHTSSPTPIEPIQVTEQPKEEEQVPTAPVQVIAQEEQTKPQQLVEEVKVEETVLPVEEIKPSVVEEVKIEENKPEEVVLPVVPPEKVEAISVQSNEEQQQSPAAVVAIEETKAHIVEEPKVEVVETTPEPVAEVINKSTTVQQETTISTEESKEVKPAVIVEIHDTDKNQQQHQHPAVETMSLHVNADKSQELTTTTTTETKLDIVEPIPTSQQQPQHQKSDISITTTSTTTTQSSSSSSSSTSNKTNSPTIKSQGVASNSKTASPKLAATQPTSKSESSEKAPLISTKVQRKCCSCYMM